MSLESNKKRKIAAVNSEATPEKNALNNKKETKPTVSDSLQILHSCPHLAVFDDPDTKLLFASPAGSCHHVQPAQGVNIEHQQSFCLSAQHKRCPAFVLENLTSLPPELARDSGKKSNGRFLKIIIAVLVMTALALGAWFLGGYNGSEGINLFSSGSNDKASNAALIPAPPSPTATTASTATTTPLPVIAAPVTEPTETAVPPTLTPEPTATEDPTATPAPTNTPEPTVTPTTTPTAEPLPVAEVIPGRLNIRGGPSTAYPALTTVDTGTLFDITGQLSDGSWYQLCCVEGDLGWVLAESVNATGLVGDIPIVTDIPPQPEN